jgi:hypothetical protein
VGGIHIALALRSIDGECLPGVAACGADLSAAIGVTVIVGGEERPDCPIEPKSMLSHLFVKVLTEGDNPGMGASIPTSPSTHHSPSAARPAMAVPVSGVPISYTPSAPPRAASVRSQYTFPCPLCVALRRTP